MSELTFHPATKSDVLSVFFLCKSLIDSYEDVDSIDYDRVIHWVGEKLQKNISAYTCVFLNGEKVGYFCLAKQEDGWELDDFYVLPHCRNQGIGTNILEHCLQLADGPVYLYVFLRNFGAIRFYERFGFSEVKRVGNTRMIMCRDS